MVRALGFAALAGLLLAILLAAGMIVFLTWPTGADDPPTLTVEASDPGATASAVEQTIAAPIEQQVNGVEHLTQMRSRCRRDGSYTLVISFAAGTDVNLALALVQNRISLAMPALPTETQQLGVTILKRSPDPLMIVALNSPDSRYDAQYLANYATIQLKDELARLPGVAEVSIVGQRDFAARISLDPEKLAARNLTFDDVTRALERQDVEATAGQPVGPARASQLTLDGPGGPVPPGQLDAIVIKTDPEGRVTRLRDVALELELGAGRDGLESLDAKPAAVLAVYPLVHARRPEVSAAVHARVSELRLRFPKGVDAFTEFDFSQEPTAQASGYLLLDVDPPAGTSVDMIARLFGRCHQVLRRLPGVQNVLALSEQPFDRDHDQRSLVVRLGPVKGAPVDRELLIREIRERFVADLQGASVRIRDLSGGSRPRRFSYPIDFAISGPDRTRVQELAGQLVARMSQDPRLTDVRAGLQPVPSLSVDIDQAKATSLGLAVADISAVIRALLGPAQPGNISLLGRTWPVRVQVGSGGRTEVDALNRLKVRTNKGQMVPLSAVATFRHEDSLSHLDRFDLLPSVSITASPAGKLTEAKGRSLCEQLAAEILPNRTPTEYRLVWPGLGTP